MDMQPILYIPYTGGNHRGDKRRNRRSFSALSAGVWLVMVTLSPPVFWQGNKNTLSLVFAYSALFHDVFKELNLFLSKYVAFGCSPNHRGAITQNSVMAWHW